MSEAQFIEIEIGRLYESPNNPRKVFEDLEELEASVREKGVLTPLLVRPNGKPDSFEILAGHRRFIAAKAAGLKSVPAIVRELDDRAALEVMILDNIQRRDVHPLDEARGYKTLIAMGPGPCKAEDIAAKIGKSVKYVYDRLKLLELTPEAEKQFVDGTLTAGHAILLARLDSDEQKDIQESIAETQSEPDGVSVRDLDNRIRWMHERKKHEAEKQAERENRKAEAKQNPAPAREHEGASPVEHAKREMSQPYDSEREFKLSILKRQAEEKALHLTIDAILQKVGTRKMPRAAWTLMASNAASNQRFVTHRKWKNHAEIEKAIARVPLEAFPYFLFEEALCSYNVDIEKTAKAFGVEPIKPEPVSLEPAEKSKVQTSAKAAKRPRSKAKKGKQG